MPERLTDTLCIKSKRPHSCWDDMNYTYQTRQLKARIISEGGRACTLASSWTTRNMDLNNFCIIIKIILLLLPFKTIWSCGHHLEYETKMKVLSGEKPKPSHLWYKDRMKRNDPILKKITPMSIIRFKKSQWRRKFLNLKINFKIKTLIFYY